MFRLISRFHPHFSFPPSFLVSTLLVYPTRCTLLGHTLDHLGSHPATFLLLYSMGPWFSKSDCEKKLDVEIQAISELINAYFRGNEKTQALHFYMQKKIELMKDSPNFGGTRRRTRRFRR